MPWMAIAGGIAATTGAVGQAVAGSDAANKQLLAAQDISSQQQRLFGQGRKQALGALDQAFGQAQGFLQGGLGQSQSTLQGLIGANAAAQQGSRTNQFFEQGIQADPGFQFRLQQGEQTINRANAARGGRLGGGALKELAGFGQGLASQEAQAAFQRASVADQGTRAFLGQQQALGGQLAGQQFGLGGQLGQAALGLGQQQAGIFQQTAGQQAAAAQLPLNLVGGAEANIANIFGQVHQGGQQLLGGGLGNAAAGGAAKLPAGAA